jgi:hypothetical protein
LTQTESVSTRNTHVRASIRGGAAEDADIERCVSTASRTRELSGRAERSDENKNVGSRKKRAHVVSQHTARAMTPASALRDVDAIVVGGIARGPDSTGCDAHVARLVRGLEQSGLAVGRVDGSDGAAREALAEALMRAVRLGEDESRPAGREGGLGLRALLVVGLDAKGAVDASRAAGVLRDEKLKWHARRFAALGGVVLVNGLGGALDAALQEWFRKPWTSGLTRKHREWRYNADAAWGEGYFARFNASSENGAPLVAFSLAAVAELESVSNAERVYFADDSEGPTEGRSSGYRAGTAISLGGYGGGYVGCFADLNMEPATVSALVALTRAAPEAGTARAAARLRRSPMRAAFASGAFSSGLDADRRERLTNSSVPNAPSKLAFAAYALVTTLITGAFFAFLARVIVRSSL